MKHIIACTALLALTMAGDAMAETVNWPPFGAPHSDGKNGIDRAKPNILKLANAGPICSCE
jgi:hypothetical protein